MLLTRYGSFRGASILVSHPSRKEREKDGAPSAVAVAARSKTKGRAIGPSWVGGWMDCGVSGDEASLVSTVKGFRAARLATAAESGCGEGSDGMAEEVAEKVGIATAAPKGAVDNGQLTASLKRCPDTKRDFFRSL